jgi:hypothetical protein
MRKCEGCALAPLGIGTTVRRCREIDGCALEELQGEHLDAHLLDPDTCKEDRLRQLVEKALKEDPTIL